MTIEERLAAMERRIAELEARIGQPPVMLSPSFPTPFLPLGPVIRGCNCPPNAACGNSNCPRVGRIVCGTAGGDHA